MPEDDDVPVEFLWATVKLRKIYRKCGLTALALALALELELELAILTMWRFE